MVLIWTQFGVKHKNGNVKCKVRVMHRGDSSGSSSSAVSTFLFVLITRFITSNSFESNLYPLCVSKTVCTGISLCSIVTYFCYCGFIQMQASLILVQPIAAENLCRWGGKSYAPHRTPPFLSRCVVHPLIKFMDMQLLSRAEIRVFSQRMSLLGARFLHIYRYSAPVGVEGVIMGWLY